MRENRWVLTDAERDALIERAARIPAVHDADAGTLYHYSEDGTIKRFAPHVPQTNPSHPPAVWAIDHAHAPLYWFPRDCPRISVWARTPEQQERLSDLFGTEAWRICATETGWIDGLRSSRIYRYEFDGSQFEPWREADGQYVAYEAIRPARVAPIDDVLGLFHDGDVELRFTPRLGTLMDQMLVSQLPFSFVRIRNARR